MRGRIAVYLCIITYLGVHKDLHLGVLFKMFLGNELRVKDNQH